MKSYIRFKPQRWENQGIQHRARFYLAAGIGSWWKIGIAVLSYYDGRENDLRGFWIEIMLG